MSETVHPAPDGWLKRFFLSLVILALLAGLLGLALRRFPPEKPGFGTLLTGALSLIHI